MSTNRHFRRVAIPTAILSLAISTTASLARADGPYCFGNVGIVTFCPCGNAGAVGNGCENSAGTGGGNLSYSGTAGSTGGTDTLALTATGLPPGTAGLFFCGTNQVLSGFGTAFGDGLMCVGGNIKRLVVVQAPLGIASYDPSSTGQLLIHVLAGTSNGDVREYQFWYRDILPYCTSATFNLTNALEITTGP